MSVTSLVVLLGVLLVYFSKSDALETQEQDVLQHKVLNLNTVASPEAILPYLDVFPHEPDRRFAADQLFRHLNPTPNARQILPNVGTLAKLRITTEAIRASDNLDYFANRLPDMQDSKTSMPTALPLFTSRTVSAIKPGFVVRTPSQFTYTFWWTLLLYFLSIYAVHMLWRMGITLRFSTTLPFVHLRRETSFEGDALLLPLFHLLTGLGLMLMLSLRDPLRDMLDFRAFTMGVGLGAILFYLSSLWNVQRWRKPIRWGGHTVHVHLVFSLGLSIILSILLVSFGSGPTGSDAKVNLFGFQPAEVIKLLLVVFLAAYFSYRWEFMRTLREQVASVPKPLRFLRIPRLRYILPVMVGTAVALLFFLLQKDLGPALILMCTFLTLYAIARNHVLVPVLGLGLLFLGFWACYAFGLVYTVANRIEMMASPWDNFAVGGEHLANAYWAITSGHWFGLGPGLGSPSLIPAAHTDMVLPALGEELGILGVLGILCLYALLIHQGLRIAKQASGMFSFFLGLGLTLITAYQIFLIAGGVFGLLPLSGVVSPFLSYGKTSMLMNGLLLGLLAAISTQTGHADQNAAFHRPLKRLQLVLGALGLMLVLRLGYIGWQSNTWIVEPALVVRGDGERGFQYNRRIGPARRALTRGTIYDRNGLPLATSNPTAVDSLKPMLQATYGLVPERYTRSTDRRFYPFGPHTFYLLGDVRSYTKREAGNSLFLEYDAATNAHLQGYEDAPRRITIASKRTGPPDLTRTVYDYSPLIPLIRQRHRIPASGGVQNLLDRDRDLTLTLDARLQVRVAEALEAGTPPGLRSAAVVLDASDGSVLAAVSHPLPHMALTDPSATNLDPDVFDRVVYGQYPPGSTFKLITSIAAMNRGTNLTQTRHKCEPLGNGRVGQKVKGWGRPIRDARGDAAHGNVNLHEGLVVSCNAFFAQLGVYDVGAPALLQAIDWFGLGLSLNPSLPKAERLDILSKDLPQASFGQGPLLASPIEMARVAATIANEGQLQPTRWMLDALQTLPQPRQVLTPDQATQLARSMRGVVTEGTGKRISGSTLPIAGKTGTAEVMIDDRRVTHAWFTGFAPYQGARPVAFAVLVEQGGDGGRVAAPIAAQIVAAAKALGLTQH